MSIRIASLISALALLVAATASASPPPALQGALLTSQMVTAERLEVLKKDGYTAAVLALHSSSADQLKQDAAAAKRIAETGLKLHYWIEIARCPELADEHPLWMASLQGHPEWRRFHKDYPFPKEGEVVKNYPWVPVLYQEAADAHLARIKKMLAVLPPAKTVYFNDLQGPPTACGCGNPVCRWTADYGPVVTATRLGDDAAAQFVAEAKKLVPRETAVIPIWTTECEEHDKENDALCAGVGCFKGTCWKVSTKQLMPLAEGSPQLGALLLYKEFGQDSVAYPQPAGWVKHALGGFATMPPKNKGKPIGPERLVAVLQGFGVTERELGEQIARAKEANAGGYIVAFMKIDQSWSPKLVKWK